jgi:predicted secreted protein
MAKGRNIVIKTDLADVVDITCPSQDYSTLVLSHNPRAYWRFGDAGSAWTSETALGDGSYFNTPLLQQQGLIVDTNCNYDPYSVEFRAAEFEYCEETGSNVLSSVNNPVQIEAWFKYRGSNVNIAQLGRDGFGAGWSLQLRMMSTGMQMRAVTVNPFPVGDTAEYSFTPVNGNDYYVVGEFVENSAIKIFVWDVTAGVYLGSNTFSIVGKTTLRTSTVGWYCAVWNDFGAYSDVVIDELAIYEDSVSNDILTFAQMEAHFAAGIAVTTTTSYVNQTVAGLRAKSVAINNDIVDISDLQDDWRQLLGDTGERTFTFAGAGVFVDDVAMREMSSRAKNGSIDTYTMYFENGAVLSGDFQITELTYEGPFDDAQVFNFTLESGNAGTDTVGPILTCPTVDYRTLVLSHSPRSYWRLNEASASPGWQSETPNGAGTYIGTPAPNFLQTGLILDSNCDPVPSAVQFNTTSYAKEVDPVGTIFSGTDYVQIEAWVKHVGGNNRIFTFGLDGSGAGYSIAVELQNAQAAMLCVTTTPSTVQTAASFPYSFVAGNTYYIVGDMRENDALTIYVWDATNGVYLGSGTASLVGKTNRRASTAGCTINVLAASPSLVLSNVYIDELAVYIQSVRLLSFAEMQSHFEAGAAIYV